MEDHDEIEALNVSDAVLFDEAVNMKMNLSRLSDDSPYRDNPLLPLYKGFADANIASNRKYLAAFGHPLPLPRIIVDYIKCSNSGVRAFIYRDHNCRNHHLIAIDYGLVFTLEFLFSALLSNPRYLSEIGSTSNECDSLPSFAVTTSYADLEAAMLSHGLTIGDFRPRDRLRNEISGFLTHIALHFLIGHEFRHIQAGHLDYLTSLTNSSVLSVDSSGHVDIPNSLKRQAMEWDADKFSLSAVFPYVWMQRKKAVSSGDYSELYNNHELLFLLTITACATLLKLVDKQKPDIGIWDSCDHPPTVCRRMILLVIGQQWAEGSFPDEFDIGNACRLTEKYVASVELLLSDIFGTNFDQTYAAQAISHSTDHQLKLMHVWKEISPSLQKFAYVPLDPCLASSFLPRSRSAK